MNAGMPIEDRSEPDGGRSIHCVAKKSLDGPFPWPTTGRLFSLLVDLDRLDLGSPTAFDTLADAVVGGGARWVVARGEGAAELEDAIIDALAAIGGSLPDGDTVVTRVENGAWSEAMWQACNLFADEHPPVVVLRVGPQEDVQALGDAVTKALRDMESHGAVSQRSVDLI